MAPFPVQLNEVCKVRNAAVARTGSGYSLAIVKKTNEASVHISLLDAKYACTDTFTVKLDTLWKLKASQRKALERKVLKACAPVPKPVPHVPEEPSAEVKELRDWLLSLDCDMEEHVDVLIRNGLTLGRLRSLSLDQLKSLLMSILPLVDRVILINELKKAFLPLGTFAKIVEEKDNIMGLSTNFKVSLGGSDTVLYIAFDSVVKFTGDAIVNAANEGCLGGGGIDGAVNYQGGIEVESARRQLPLLDDSYYKRCDTGDAKITIAGALPCMKVIHAVGPRFGYGYDHDDNLNMLENAYKNSMLRARESGLKTVAFCILSAGIFRGNCPLKTVIKRGMDAIAKNTYFGLEQVVFCGFTSNEQMELDSILKDIAKDIGEMAHGPF